MQRYNFHFLRHASLGLLLAFSLAFPSAAFAIVGKFQFVNGEVMVINAQGQQRAVKKGDTIDEGDTVATAGSGFAQIKMEDGGFFAVRPGTQFKVDTFKYNGKDDGSEKGVFGLIKGSLRSVTGIIGKKHHDNYKIQTATSTIGIRGSGADVGYEDGVGTAVHTLFGGHTLTTNVNGQSITIETGPGQTAFAPPGEAPKIVPIFPFNTDNSGVQTSSKSADSGNENSGGANEDKKNIAGNLNGENDGAFNEIVADDDIVIPVTATDGTNLTENEDSAGNSLSGGTTLPVGQYIHHISGIVPQGTGFLHTEHNNSGNFGDDESNVRFGGNGGLNSIADTELSVDDAGGQYFQHSGSSMRVNGGTDADLYSTPDGSIHIGRIHGGSITNCTPSCLTDNIVDAHWVVAKIGAFELVQTLTGTTSYNLAGATHPTDAAGNVGTLTSATLNANFTTQTMGFSLGLNIAGNAFSAGAAGVPILNSGFSAQSLTATCTGPCALGTYTGQVGGGFFGGGAATAALGYDFWPSSNVSGNYTDYITGLVAFTAASAPTMTATTPEPLGSGVATTALFSAGDPSASLHPLNQFNLNDANHFSSSKDASGNMVAFARDGSGGGSELSFGLGSGTLVNTGSDALGVNWGRWTGSYIANSHNSGTTYTNTPLGSLHFIAADHITTGSELGALSLVANYNVSFVGTSPTDNSGGVGSLILANATVNFTTAQVVSYSIQGNGATSFGSWNALGSGSIGNFVSSSGIALSGACSGGVGSCASVGTTVSGKATGNFVGTTALGMISTYSLASTGSEKLAGAVLMKR